MDLWPVKFGTDGVLELCEVMPPGVGIGGSCDPFAVFGPSFGGWELAEVISSVRLSLWSSYRCYGNGQ